MTSPKVTRNVYCTDPEDRVIPFSCKVCSRCWLFVASKGGARNGRCVFGGPFGEFEREGVEEDQKEQENGECN